MARLNCKPKTKIKLLCFPYAGGDQVIYRNWSSLFSKEIDIIPVVLAGRGKRYSELPISDWKELIDDMWILLRPYLDYPHIFFGHSFGGRIAYELAHRCQEEDIRNTNLLFISACRSPRYPQKKPYMYLMSDSNLLQAIKDMGGNQNSLLENKDIMQLMLPTLRADIKLAETWINHHDQKLDVPIVAFYGENDPIESDKSLLDWQQFTTKNFAIEKLDGGHFFLHENEKNIILLINKYISKL